MKRIAVDMDDVIADFLGGFLRFYNSRYGDSVTREDLKGISFYKLRPQVTREEITEILDGDFFRRLDVIAGSREVLRELSEHYEIFIATAAMEMPSSFEAKYEWLREHFPFLNPLNFVFCGDKSIIQADYLIDDHPHHFKRFKGQGLLFTSPPNMNETGYPRLNNWREVREYFLA